MTYLYDEFDIFIAYEVKSSDSQLTFQWVINNGWKIQFVQTFTDYQYHRADSILSNRGE